MRNYFVIEKDRDTIRTIQNTLEDIDRFHFLGYAYGPEEALDVLLRQKPDLVFIRIDNGFPSPFTFVSELHLYDCPVPCFIAISKTRDDAYTAFKYNFFDYILHPVSGLEVRKSILRYHKRNPIRANLVCIQSNKDYKYLDTNNILFLKADNNTTDFHLTDGRVIGAFKTLKSFEDKLPDNFMRIHKSYIVNAAQVARIHYGKAVCTLRQYRQPIPFTRTFRKNIDRVHYLLNQASF
ncbi:LytTR family DNA-binding domain-containing protein [Sinomicrobium kalidii]|uniref:LytR/AlgR family response regulator transcription factor n=1 Tax=Sinomicrobium kalidii TaxID=2900738 RepID=UPI001E5E3B65|nr:LytTR family DNA-binding domain-containing protein [Sinomicrobium kalidii]UGU16530.1 LytTR family DNA-binding domain-containing protein [Sinomicrobium kalidii]